MKFVREPILVRKTEAGETEMTPIPELERLNAKRVELVNEIGELDVKIMALKKERAQQLMAEYKALGLDEVPFPLKSAGKPKATRRSKLDKPCSYCGEKGHDARKHLGEIKAKKAARAVRHQ
jgi:hypothetical protein